MSTTTTTTTTTSNNTKYIKLSNEKGFLKNSNGDINNLSISNDGVKINTFNNNKNVSGDLPPPPPSLPLNSSTSSTSSTFSNNNNIFPVSTKNTINSDINTNTTTTTTTATTTTNINSTPTKKIINDSNTIKSSSNNSIKKNNNNEEYCEIELDILPNTMGAILTNPSSKFDSKKEKEKAKEKESLISKHTEDDDVYDTISINSSSGGGGYLRESLKDRAYNHLLKASTGLASSVHLEAHHVLHTSSSDAFLQSAPSEPTITIDLRKSQKIIIKHTENNQIEPIGDDEDGDSNTPGDGTEQPTTTPTESQPTEPVTWKQFIQTKQGLLFMIASAFLFSIMALLVKTLSKDMPSLEIAFLRSFYNLVGCLIILFILKENPLGAKPKRLFLSIRGLSGTVSLAAYFFTLSVLPLSEAVIISFTSPVITAALAAVILKERWGPFEALCAVLSLAGVVIISKPGFLFGSETSDPELPGHLKLVYILVGVGGACFTAFSYIAVRVIGPGTNPFVLGFYFSLVSSITMLPATFIFQEFVWPDWKGWLIISIIGVIATIAQTAANRGIQLEKAAKAAAMNYLQIIFTFLWEIIFLKERIDLWTMVGAGLILSCAVITAVKR
eukprot:gene7717-9491_t